jgi:putative transposase
MKAVIFARVSSREQEQGHSISAQTDRLKDYCKNKNLEIIKECEIVESSTKGERKKFNETIDFIKSRGEITALVADAVDRVQRGFKESVILSELILAEKVELHFLRENIIVNKRSEGNETFVWDFSVLGAKMYVDSLRKNVKRSLKYKRENGEWTHYAPIGLKTIYTKPNLSISNKAHKKYPYLLKDLEIKRINQVWSSDITYIKLNKGYVYLTAIKDLYSRKLLSWSLSNSLDAIFCVESLNKAIRSYGVPEIFNTDQGSQYTSDDFINVLENNNIQISMDGKGRAIDNIYIERFWRSLKYEDIYLNSYETINELKKGVDKYIKFFNKERIHQSLDYKTPDSIYYSNLNIDLVA